MEEAGSKIVKKNFCWYAVYTASRAEKRVQKQLKEVGIENYLPLQQVVRLWADRKRQISTPVIPRIIFVHIAKEAIAKVIAIRGVAFLLKEGGICVSIPDTQMNLFRQMADSANGNIQFAPLGLLLGDSVRVIQGPLQGLIGKLAKSVTGDSRVVIRMDGLGYALVTVPSGYIEKV